MGWILRTILKLIVNLAILHEHVEDGVLAMVDGAECVHDHFLLAFVTKGNRINPMVHLQFVLIRLGFLHVHLSPLVVGARVAALTEVELTCDFRDVETTIHFALVAIAQECVDVLRHAVLIIKIKLLIIKWSVSLVLHDHVLVGVDVGPGEVTYYLIWRDVIHRRSQRRLDQETWNVWEDDFQINRYMRMLRRISAHCCRLLDQWCLQHFVLLER